MRKTQKKTIFVFFLLSLFFLDPMVGHGQNLESTDTVAKLGFTGVYDSPLSPIPQPPNGAQLEKDSIEKLYSSKKLYQSYQIQQMSNLNFWGLSYY